MTRTEQELVDVIRELLDMITNNQTHGPAVYKAANLVHRLDDRACGDWQFERDCEVATRLAERDEDEYTDPGDLDEPEAEEAL